MDVSDIQDLYTELKSDMKPNVKNRYNKPNKFSKY